MQIQFNTFADFVSMGGFGIYVWSVYFLALGFLAIGFLYPILSLRKLHKSQNLYNSQKSANSQESNSKQDNSI